MAFTDSDVGVTEVLGSHRPFRAVLKQTVEDFVVNEVLLSGEVARLTRLPEFSRSKMKPSNNEPVKEEQLDTNVTDSSKEIPYSLLEELFPNAEAKSVSESVRTVLKTDANELILPVCTDKAKRTAIHAWVRENLSAYVTDTVEQGGGRAVRLRKRSAYRPWKRRPSKRRRTADGEDRPSDAADENTYDPREIDPRAARRRAELNGDEGYVGRNTYVSFVLWKRNTDTMDALNYLSRILRLPPSAFTFAGTKDKRGVTTQRIHVRGISEGRLAHVNRYLARRDRGVKSMAVGNFEILSGEKGGPLKLGDLKGNRFTIALRDLDIEGATDEENIKQAVASLRLRGFVNYFGLQRFGSGVSGTHETGFALLREDFKDVCRRILQPLDIQQLSSNPEKIRAERLKPIEALRKFEKREITAQELLKELPRWMHIERALAESFAHDESRGVTKFDYRAAFEKLPRNLRRMYGHAVQSYLWNVMASYRIRMNPPKESSRMHALKGDLILMNEESKDSLNYQTQVRVVTEEEETEKSISVFKVLIPVLGSDVPIPDTEYGNAAREILKREGIDMQSQMGADIRGTYRFLMARPHDIDMEIVSYSDSTEVLIRQARTPFEAIMQKEQTLEKENGSTPDTSKFRESTAPSDAVPKLYAGGEGGQESLPDTLISDPTAQDSDLGNDPASTTKESLEANDSALKTLKKALVISFTLGCSEYATMLVRELTHKDSSTANHKAMQNIA